MRRQHSRLLREERRMAVRYGKRNPGTSLGRCIACHAVFDAAGQPVAYDNERHFCRACHAKVAVAPDCFSCHRSTPPQARGTP
jgi:predicted CXXCH cytochrome family protein